MATTQELIDSLCTRFPDDAGDLREALEVLRQQRISSCERLARLVDSQWQRLGLPLGVEALLRDEVAAALAPPAPEEESAAAAGAAPTGGGAGHARPGASVPAPAPPGLRVSARSRAAEAGNAGEDGDGGETAPDLFEPPEGLYRRGASSLGGGRARAELRGSCSSSAVKSERKGGPPRPMDLLPPQDMDLLWQQLLEDTLPPDKRAALQESWEATGNAHDRYMMFLEYSSYLRKPEVSEEEKAERRKQLDPLVRVFGLRGDDKESSDGQGATVWWLLAGALLLFAGTVYYANATADPAHDLQAL